MSICDLHKLRCFVSLFLMIFAPSWNSDTPHIALKLMFSFFFCTDSSDDSNDCSIAWNRFPCDICTDPSSIEGGEIILNAEGHFLISKDAWQGVSMQRVEKLPFDVDGFSLYSLSSHSRLSLLEKCRDSRPWKRDTKTNWRGYESV